MKFWIALVSAMVLGIGGGIGAAVVRVQMNPWDGTGSGSRAPAERADLPVPEGPAPKVEVKEDTHDFGAMDSHAKGTHDFVLSNVGDAPLTLRKGATTCKCAASILEKGEIAPGQSSKVTVEWTGKDYVGEFTQSAEILTNDPRSPRVKLRIKGRITVAVRAVPSELVLSRITAGAPYTASVQLFGFRSKPLEITEHELTGSGKPECFELAFRSMTSDELEAEQDATSGTVASVTIKPGLPLGAFRQTILLKTNYKEAPEIEVPVWGTIGSEISVVGRGWNEETGVLTLGWLKSDEGIERNLFIRAGGPHFKEVHFKPITIDPDDLLKVKPGETTLLENGKASLTRLTIEVPKGSRPANHSGSEEAKLGQIILETGHPKAPELRILVRFTVEG